MNMSNEHIYIASCASMARLLETVAVQQAGESQREQEKAGESQRESQRELEREPERHCDIMLPIM